MLLFYVVLLILNIISVLCETFTHLTNVNFSLASHRTRNFNQLPHMVDDTIGDGSAQNQKRKRNVLKDEIRLWPNGRVPYRISTELYNNVTIRENIAAAMLEISKVSCVRFENNQANDVERLDIIRAKSKQNPCLSNIGRQPGKPTQLELTPTLDYCTTTSTLIHELMHVLGFHHEHNRSDRDQYVKILWENVNPKFKRAFEKVSNSEFAIHTVYDYRSILHYSETASNKGNGKFTIVAKNGTAITMGNTVLSPLDIDKLNQVYKCSEKSNNAKSRDSNCFDQKPKECNEWVKRGECAKNRSYMLLNCRKSCGSCNA